MTETKADLHESCRGEITRLRRRNKKLELLLAELHSRVEAVWSKPSELYIKTELHERVISALSESG